MSRKSKNKRKYGYGILLVNILIAIGFLLLANISITRARREIVGESISSDEQRLQSLSSSFSNYIRNENNTIKGYGNYIEECNMTEAEALEYLSHWKDNYIEISLINSDKLDGWYITPDSQVYKWRSYHLASWLSDIISENDYHKSHKVPGQDEVCATLVSESTPDDNRVALSTFINVSGNNYVLLCQYRLEDCLIYGLKIPVNEIGRCVLINKNGNVCFGVLNGYPNSSETNYWDYLTDLVGESYAQTIKTNISVNDSLHFTSNSKSDNSVSIMSNIPDSDGWIIIYKIYNDELGFNRGTLHAIFTTMVFLFIWLVFDITIYVLYTRNLKKLMKQTEAQNEELERANHAKTVFVSNVSHEIRTPINAVLGLDEMIIRETSDDNIKSYAYDIRKAGNILLGIINDVLDFSKIESGKLEIVQAKYSPVEMIQEIYTLIELKAKAKYLDFYVNVDSNLPSLLYGDDIRIKQVIINLLTNAVKYTKQGQIELIIECTLVNNGEASLKVSVKDTGMGVKKEEIDKLLIPYQRLDENENRSVEGTGLGLPIVEKLLNMMGSHLQVESEYGKGSTFFFEIEQTIVDPKKIGFIDVEKHQDNDQISEILLYAPDARILVVDDTPLNITVVKGLLKNTGIIIDEANSGYGCLKKTEEEDYDLILLDHRMPEMDGVETLHALKERNGRNVNTPVIVLTANVVSGAREMYLEEGFSDFLSKPINGKLLCDTISKYLPLEAFKQRPNNVCEKKKFEFTGDLAIEIDLNEGLKNTGEDLDLYTEILKEFSAQYRSVESNVRKYRDERNSVEYTTLVHSLKSSARTIGAKRLFKQANILEICGHSEDWDSIDERTDYMLLEFERVGKLLDDFLKQ